MKESARLLSWVVASVFLFLSAPAVAEKDALVFSAPPGEAPEAADFYKPLVDLMAKASGKKVVMQPAANYVEYVRTMREGGYDLVLDGSHLAAWRMARVGHAPLVRLAGDVRIVVATRQDGPKALDELASGRRVCALPSPNQSNLIFQQQFQNPARQPVIVAVRSAGELKDCLTGKRGDAAVFPSYIWEAMDTKDLRTLPLAAPASYPERTLTVSGKVDPDTRAKISAALLGEEGTKALAPLLKYYKTEKLVPADAKTYEQAGALLQQAAGFQ